MNLYWINHFRIDVLLNGVLREFTKILFDVISIVTFPLSTENKMADVRYKDIKCLAKDVKYAIRHLAL